MISNSTVYLTTSRSLPFFYLSFHSLVKSVKTRREEAEGITSAYWHTAEASYLPNQISNNMQSLYTISAELQTRSQCDILSGICCSNWINISTHMLPINKQQNWGQLHSLTVKIETLMVWNKTVIPLTSPHEVLAPFIDAGLATLHVYCGFGMWLPNL